MRCMFERLTQESSLTTTVLTYIACNRCECGDKRKTPHVTEQMNFTDQLIPAIQFKTSEKSKGVFSITNQKGETKHLDANQHGTLEGPTENEKKKEEVWDAHIFLFIKNRNCPKITKTAETKKRKENITKRSLLGARTSLCHHLSQFDDHQLHLPSPNFSFSIQKKSLSLSSRLVRTE